MKSYGHITAVERDRIAVMKAEGRTLSEIGTELGRHKSTISREVRRNCASVHRPRYYGSQAHERARLRWMESHRRERMACSITREYVELKLRQRVTPELITGRIGLEHPGLSVSHETIYQWIYTEARYLIPYLPRGLWKRRKRGYSRKVRRPLIPNRRDISERSAEADKREALGHWESDSMCNRQRGPAVNVLTDRASRFTFISRLERKTSEATKAAIINRLKGLPVNRRKSITYDNGTENASHEKVNMKLKTESYFCGPYRSWEKGTVENTIGLIRRWLPKKTDLSKVTDKQLVEIEKWLNNRPRKCLGFRTPAEVFSGGVALCA